MQQLKKSEDIDWRDMEKIENPFFAKFDLKNNFYCHDNVEPILGFRDILQSCAYGQGGRDKRALGRLLEKLNQGKCFLLKTKPFTPVIRWEKDAADPLGGHWAKTGLLDRATNPAVDRLITKLTSKQGPPAVNADTDLDSGPV